MNPSSKTVKTRGLSVHESPYLRTQRVMNLKILNELRNRVQLPRVFRRRSKKSQKNNLALELFRFEISKSKDCVKRIQRTWRANTWKKAAFFLRLHSSVIACRGPSLLFLFSAACFLRPEERRARVRARERSLARAHAFSFVRPPRIYL